MRERGKGRRDKSRIPANENGGPALAAPEPEILLIAAAIGRGMARDLLAERSGANDNRC
jgi:hypothetical protein